MNRKLSYYYTFPRSSAYLASPGQLLRVVRKRHPEITLRHVKAYLSQQPAYQLHKKCRRTKKFKERVSKCVPIGFQTDHQMDLADMSKLAAANSNAHFILVCVDTLSRLADATPLKTKSAEDMLAALKRIYERHRILSLPWRIYHDNGKEFKNKTVATYLRKNFIQQLHSTSDAKASIGALAKSTLWVLCAFHCSFAAERFIRDLKAKLYAHFTHTNSNNYTKVLPHIISAMNRTPSRKHGLQPVQINKSNEVKCLVNESINMSALV